MRPARAAASRILGALDLESQAAQKDADICGPCTTLQIWSDIALVFTNAMLYNPPGSDVNIMAQTVHEAAEERWEKDISSKIAAEQAWAVREEVSRAHCILA